MFTLTDIRLAALATHYVGNDAAGDSLHLTKQPVPLEDEETKAILTQYFLSPFKEGASYHLAHPSDLALNEVYHHVSALFDDPGALMESSVRLARHLHRITTLPQIRSGELHVAYFTGVPVEGRMTDAVAICKTEAKSRYLKLSETADSYAFQPDEGIDPTRLDKGCLIVNVQREEGYLVYVTDRTSKGGEAQFWKDTFLQIRAASSSYHATEDYLRMAKVFIEDGLPQDFEVERVEQIDMMRKSVGYFSKNEQFNAGEFAEAVFGATEIIQSFRRHEERYVSDHDLSFEGEFDISAQAVKKVAKGIKSVLKLDKNFSVYVHGDRSRIERGRDEGTGMHYYKLYFEEER